MKIVISDENYPCMSDCTISYDVKGEIYSIVSLRRRNEERSINRVEKTRSLFFPITYRYVLEIEYTGIERYMRTI